MTVKKIAEIIRKEALMLKRILRGMAGPWCVSVSRRIFDRAMS
jgi:hypothetical protein